MKKAINSESSCEKAMWIKIDHRKYTIEVEDGRDTYGEWERPDTTTDHKILGFELTKEYGDLAVDFLPKKEKDYYLVYVTYSTGDSFGYDENYGIVFIGLYKTVEKANAVAEQIRIHEKTKSSHDLIIELETGKKMKVYEAWRGYFEHINSIEVTEVKIQKQLASYRFR